MCKILSRIKVIAEAEGISIGMIERAIGASRGVISKAIAKGTDIQSKWLELICEQFPQYSPVWLLTGEGDMLRGNRGIISASEEISPKQSLAKTIVDDTRKLSHTIHEDTKGNNVITRPRIPFDAAAGSLTVALGAVAEYECEQMPIIPSFPKYDFTIVARGDSMIPEFQSGDELACAFVKESSFIQWGRSHVLDTAQGVVLKKIFNNNSSIICRSINRDYPDFEVPKNEIYHIAIVVGLLRHF